jgi:hypothetical protein
MANRLQTPLPTRCLLYQAPLWVAEEFVPTDDRIFMSLPDRSWGTVKEKHKRGSADCPEVRNLTGPRCFYA